MLLIPTLGPSHTTAYYKGNKKQLYECTVSPNLKKEKYKEFEKYKSNVLLKHEIIKIFPN